MDAMSSKKQQLACLNRIQHAANQTWKVNANATSNNSGNGSDQSLTPFQRFECKLAQVIQPEKGAATIAALTCLKDANGRAEFILTSNSLKDTEIEDVVNFLRDLLTYTRDNPEDLKSKPLQKQVMWRILEFNFGKVRCYLQSLILALEQCIAECELKLNGANTGMSIHLRIGVPVLAEGSCFQASCAYNRQVLRRS